MTFEEALSALKSGLNVGRPNQESIWLQLKTNIWREGSPDFAELTLTVEDLLATDWEYNTQQYPEGPPAAVAKALRY